MRQAIATPFRRIELPNTHVYMNAEFYVCVCTALPAAEVLYHLMAAERGDKPYPPSHVWVLSSQRRCDMPGRYHFQFHRSLVRSEQR